MSDLPEIVDTNVSLSRWPTRRLPGDEPAELVARLRQVGVVQAWAGSFDALLHKDLGGVNARLVADCALHGKDFLVPWGSVNPRLPDWQEELRRCHEVHKMPGIRLFPGYHGYRLDEPLAAALLEQAADRGLAVQIAVRMEDPRTQHRLLAAPDVDPAPLVELLARFPRLRVQLLNGLNVVRADLLDKLLTAGRVTVEIAMLEGITGLTTLLAHVPADRVLFGSHYPFFAWQAAALKLQESALGSQQTAAICSQNARAWLGGA